MSTGGRTGLSASSAVEYLNEVFEALGYAMLAVAETSGISIKSGDESITYAQLYTVTNTSKAGYTLYYNNGESSVQVNRGNGAVNTYDIYYASNGILLHYYRSQEPTYAVDMFITRNSDGTYIFGAMQSATSYLTNTAIYTRPTIATPTYTFNSDNNTGLLNMTTNGDIGERGICENCYAMMFRQYSVPGILTLDDEDYISNGYWCIKDGGTE